MICPRCKKELNEDMSYCPQCGMKIEKCPVCHQPVIQGAKYCSHCGTGLNERYQESQIAGHYQPLSQTQANNIDEDTQTQTSFQDVPTNKKVNKKLIIIMVSVLVVVTVISLIYIYKGPSFPVKDSAQNETAFSQGETIKVGGTNTFSTHTGNINNEGHADVSGDRIYLVDDNDKLISMDQKLENRQTLVNEECDYMNVVDDIIYYTNSKHQLSSITTDGKDQKVILNKEIYYLIIKDNKAYYQAQDEDQERIYVYDLQTNKEERLNDCHSYCLNVLDDKIYYVSTDGIYSMNKDGQGDEKILSENAVNLIYQEGKLYFDTSENMTKSYDINSRETETIIQSTSRMINLTNDYLFYLSQQGVMKYDIKTKESTKIYSGSVESGQIIGDKLILETVSLSYSQDKNDYQIIVDFDGKQQQRLFVEDNGDYI